MEGKVKIFDTTLRDGEQTPRVNMNIEDKIRIAKQLEKLGVDIIEAGFPVVSDGDFEAVKAISETVERPVVCGLARAKKLDIDRAIEALENAKHPRVHIFIATSDIHLEHKLKITREECVKQAVEMVAYAKERVEDIEFSAEDASRTDKDFLCEIFEAVIKAGATTLNVPDTVGFIQTCEYGEFISYIMENTKGIENVIVSVHCHDDLGMATSNSIAGVLAGARQIECTINGLGERAGNTSLEEVAMIFDTRKDVYNLDTNIKLDEIYKSSKMVSEISGVDICATKSIVGENCFLHESGIHQDGILKNRATYEIMDPKKIGIPDNDGLVLGKHSGRHAFQNFLKNNGINIEGEALDISFKKFKLMTDNKKYITTEDIVSLLEEDSTYEGNYKFHSYSSRSNGNGEVEVEIKILKGDELITGIAHGNGQVDASYNAINKIVKKPIEILNYEINAITGRSDAVGEARVKMRLGNKNINSSGLDIDIITASIKAYIQGVNKLEISNN